MGEVLLKKGITPDLILSSPAKRAKKTAKKIAKKVGYSIDNIIYEKRLYEATKDDIKDCIKNVANDIDSVFLVSHNPALNDISKEFVDFNENIVTSGIVAIEFRIDRWRDLNKNSAKFLFFEYPKKHYSLM